MSSRRYKGPPGYSSIGGVECFKRDDRNLWVKRNGFIFTIPAWSIHQSSQVKTSGDAGNLIVSYSIARRRGW